MKHMEVECRSSSSSTVVDAGPKPRSLFVVVSYGGETQYFSCILQLETKAAHLASKGSPKLLSSVDAQENQYEYVAHFEQPQGYPPIRWVFSQLPCSPEYLCVVPDWGPRLHRQSAPSLYGCIFNLKTKKCNSIKPPGGARYFEHVVDLGDHTYFMGYPRTNYDPGFFFARYNRLKDSWETLKPFPYLDVKYVGHGLVGIIVATAVWNDIILLTMTCCGMWAYDVCTNKWYCVHDRDSMSNKIVGKAVFLESTQTIYALAREKGSIVALSIERNKINGDIVFECSLRCKIAVPGMDAVYYDVRLTWVPTRDLVLLGEDNFCIVQSCNSMDRIDYQPIQLTFLEHKGEESITMTGTSVHYIKLLQNEQFKIELCFSLPEYQTTAFKGGNRFFSFDPFPEHYAPKSLTWYKGPPSIDVDFSSRQSLGNVLGQTHMFEQGHSINVADVPHVTLKQLEETLKKFGKKVQSLDNDSSQTNMNVEQGHSVKVVNISPQATVKQLEEALRIFGPIKKNGIQVTNTRVGKPCAIVEFKNAASKRRAIKVSTIRVERFQAVIQERRKP